MIDELILTHKVSEEVEANRSSAGAIYRNTELNI